MSIWDTQICSNLYIRFLLVVAIAIPGQLEQNADPKLARITVGRSFVASMDDGK